MTRLRVLGRLVHALLALSVPTGYACPQCRVRPGKAHRAGCGVGAWDGGIWA